MAKKLKISIRKVLQVFVTLVMASACIVAIISASKIEGDKVLERVEVHINSGKKYHFIEEKQILNEAINNRNIDIMHTPIRKLDMEAMEHVLKTDPWVADAMLYVDAKRVMHISVTQRIPIARLFAQDGSSYYMDNTLSVMPLSPDFIYYTSVITNVPPLKDDSAARSVKKQIAMLTRAIQADTFWNAQVSQIIVDSDMTFELMPVLGQQRIIFGDTSRMKEKFNDLFAFYKNVLNRIGWDKYEMLDVRFRGQVIASPALPYKGPVDKATANMNWINSIVETEARKDSVHAQSVKDKSKEQKAAPTVAAVAGKAIKKDEKKDVKKNGKKEAPVVPKAATNKDKADKEKPKDKGKAKYTLPGN